MLVSLHTIEVCGMNKRLIGGAGPHSLGYVRQSIQLWYTFRLKVKNCHPVLIALKKIIQNYILVVFPRYFKYSDTKSITSRLNKE